MSVIMTMIAEGDPARLEQFAAANPDKMAAIRDHAVEHGLIAHRFYGSDGQIMVIDEWPDEQSFLDFFAHMASEIGPMMQEAGITSEPHPSSGRRSSLATPTAGTPDGSHISLSRDELASRPGGVPR